MQPVEFGVGTPAICGGSLADGSMSLERAIDRLDRAQAGGIATNGAQMAGEVAEPISAPACYLLN
jgi:hypothetical protein